MIWIEDDETGRKVHLEGSIDGYGKITLVDTAVAVDTSGFNTAGSGTEVNAVLVELEQRIYDLENPA